MLVTTGALGYEVHALHCTSIFNNAERLPFLPSNEPFLSKIQHIGQVHLYSRRNKGCLLTTDTAATRHQAWVA